MWSHNGIDLGQNFRLKLLNIFRNIFGHEVRLVISSILHGGTSNIFQSTMRGDEMGLKIGPRMFDGGATIPCRLSLLEIASFSYDVKTLVDDLSLAFREVGSFR